MTSRHLSLWLLLAALFLTGCGGSNLKIAPVSGTITLDGTPLAAASVSFQPKEGGRPSFGVTNAQGRYILEYSLNDLGAKVGPCTVRISTYSHRDDGKTVKEQVPKRYFTTPLEVEVKSKSNTIDFPLTSK